MSNSLHRNPEFKNVTCSQSFRMSSLCMLLRAYPEMICTQFAGILSVMLRRFPLKLTPVKDDNVAMRKSSPRTSSIPGRMEY